MKHSYAPLLMVALAGVMIMLAMALYLSTWLTRGQDIRCLRAALVTAMDASVQAAREGGNPDAEIRARLFEGIKRDVLGNRECPELSNA